MVATRYHDWPTIVRSSAGHTVGFTSRRSRRFSWSYDSRYRRVFTYLLSRYEST